MSVIEKFSLKDSLAIVTGGAGLLGKQHVEALIEAGADVIIFDINENALEETKKYFLKKYNTDVLSLKVDITNEDEILKAKEKIFKHFSKFPNILINNAAIDPKFEKNSAVNKSRLENFDARQWNLEISVGLTGAMLCSKIFGAEMAKNKRGIILNIASDLGVIAPDQRLYKQDGLKDEEQNVKPVTYSVIKHGLIGLTKYIATYWADKGVRCNAFAPGGVFNNHSDEFVNKIAQLIPMKRMANLDEYKASVVFLCSDASSYMNGATLNMDGGRSVW
ncbi:MAG: SDR family oxidoreductase [Sulfurimonas sp.]|uniref:SDR family oxidoreductase n=1 Tax=Sulfurimonas sp. TaxID=2022749 RepID=UPI00261A373E|nr:SDR family oxidoreductase [Sulfurimonas sp.]MDD5372767.1 SDR family oxidoreductase [Sulfurimonas sp.]